MGHSRGVVLPKYALNRVNVSKAGRIYQTDTPSWRSGEARSIGDEPVDLPWRIEKEIGLLTSLWPSVGDYRLCRLSASRVGASRSRHNFG